MGRQVQGCKRAKKTPAGFRYQGQIFRSTGESRIRHSKLDVVVTLDRAEDQETFAGLPLSLRPGEYWPSALGNPIHSAVQILHNFRRASRSPG